MDVKHRRRLVEAPTVSEKRPQGQFELGAVLGVMVAHRPEHRTRESREARTVVVGEQRAVRADVIVGGDRSGLAALLSCAARLARLDDGSAQLRVSVGKSLHADGGLLMRPSRLKRARDLVGSFERHEAQPAGEHVDPVVPLVDM